MDDLPFRELLEVTLLSCGQQVPGADSGDLGARRRCAGAGSKCACGGWAGARLIPLPLATGAVQGKVVGASQFYSHNFTRCSSQFFSSWDW